jgi:hypothetical protein
MTFLFLIIINFMSIAYGFHLYTFRQHGKVGSGIISSSNVFLREYFVSFIHCAGIFVILFCF